MKMPEPMMPPMTIIVGGIGVIVAVGVIALLAFTPKIRDRQGAAATFVKSEVGGEDNLELIPSEIERLLIPLPTAAADHQMHNARVLESAHPALDNQVLVRDTFRLAMTDDKAILGAENLLRVTYRGRYGGFAGGRWIDPTRRTLNAPRS